jgi:hypothetical protein
MVVCGLAATPALADAPATFCVGAAKEDVTPSPQQLQEGFYNGGYGIGPQHQAKSVIRDIYFRVIAVGRPDASGSCAGGGTDQDVIGAIDSQGYSIAYQQGFPGYGAGFRDIENDVQSQLGIPPSHIILQSTHDHNGPDEIGVWGGVPADYYQFVKSQMETGIAMAVQSEQPAQLKWGTADMTGFSGTFGSNTDDTNTGDNADYPMDQQLRVLQATSPSTGAVIATMVNYSTHATVYGPRNAVLPDWPGSTATFLEGNEQNATGTYGYPGSVAVVTVGAMGHTWPAGTPQGTDPTVDPAPNTDNGPADIYGNAVARMAMNAAASGTYLTDGTVTGTEHKIRVENTNPILLAAGGEPSNSTPLGGYKIGRSLTPPWGAGDVFISEVTALRIGDVPFFSVPGEPYPSIKFTLNQDVKAPVSFVFGLGQDQLGYAEEVADYNGAFQCSTTDEWFFTISPVFGSDVARIQQANAKALGFGVKPLSSVPAYGPGPVPPGTNCTEQQVEQGPGGLPVG